MPKESRKVSKPEYDIPPDPVIEAYKKDVDMTLIRESLKKTLEERIQTLMDLQRTAEELRRAGREARGRG
jgi:hypothetical protein